MPLGPNLRKRAGRSLSRMQALLALGTGAAAEPVAGVAGLYGLLTGGLDKGAQNVHMTREALTYQPTRPEGLQELGAALAPIVEPIERAKSYLGDGVLDRTGSPGLATAAYMAPEVLATLVGARMSGVKGPTMQQMAERSAGPYYGSPRAQAGAIMPDEFRGRRAEGGPIHEATGLPLNPDGTVTVYHHTSAANAESIRRTGRLESAAEPDVYVTTWDVPDTGYGDTPVAVRVDPRLLLLDDEFPSGRRDFRISGKSVPVKFK